jgi:PhnO protein
MFRKACAEDCRAVYDLICDLVRRQLPYEPFAEIFLAQLGDPRFFCLLCEQEEDVIGVLNLRWEEQLHHAGKIAEIMEFVVSPPCRNRGVGTAMLAHACRLAAEHGCGQIEVACNQLRTEAHRFYLREGMHNFHYKFSRSLREEDGAENRIGR